MWIILLVSVVKKKKGDKRLLGFSTSSFAAESFKWTTIFEGDCTSTPLEPRDSVVF